jgi:hypothetical protein
MTTTLRRVGLVVVALGAALAMTAMSVAAQQSGTIYPTGGAVPAGGTTTVPDPYANATNAQLTGAIPNYITATGCDADDYSCLAANGIYPYGGYPGYPGYPAPYPGYPAYPGYPGYGAPPPGVVPSAPYPTGGVQPPGGAPLMGYAQNYNFSFRYYGIPDAYFTSNSCAVGDYTCLFGKMGNGAMIPASFFAAVGCATNDYACATSQTVFTNAGCTIGNYTCVYMKTGKKP